jgi:hypothetical protein
MKSLEWQVCPYVQRYSWAIRGYSSSKFKYTQRLQRLIKVVISDPRLLGFCDTLAKPWRGTSRSTKPFWNE